MKALLLAGFILTALIPAAYADNITVKSGSGVTFLDSGLISTDFTSAFTSANFASARSGPAGIVQTNTPFWVTSLSSGPGAVWIGTNSTASTIVGDTALYAVSFNIPDAFVSGSLTMYYAVDNQLGGTNNAGIYLNGIALPSSTGIGTFTSQYTYSNTNIGADLVQGTNWLYIDAVNLGQPAGLIFSANIVTVNAASAVTPEPASLCLSLAAFLAVGVIWTVRKNNRAGAITQALAESAQ